MFSSYNYRLNRAYTLAKRIPFDQSSRFILFSDVHRGDNGFSDDFADNRNTYYHALKHYYEQGYTYIELGDGDELWKNIHFERILDAHKNVYLLLRDFYTSGRLHMIWGNHDMVYRDKEYVKKHLYEYFDQKRGLRVALFPGIEIEEGLVLQDKHSGRELFLIHGHQADYMNYVLWRFNRFMVRFLWRPLQVIGIQDPTSPARNYKELIRQEKRIKKWIMKKNNKPVVISGHTHRPRFPEPNEIPFFNDGSCVHPRTITGIEIYQSAISLVKWFVDTTDDGVLQIKRSVLEGPRSLELYS